jgi:hypothetical protein
MEGKKEQVDVTVSGDEVNLKKAGTYTIKYNCKNSDGVSASPKARTVIVDPAQIDDWWEGEAQIQIGGYSSKTFGPLQKKEFGLALATSLDIPKSCVEITGVKDGTAAINKLLDAKISVDIHFQIKVMQETLINEVVNRMQDPKFDTNLQAEMKKDGLSVGDKALAVDKQVSVKNVLRSTLVAGLSGGAILAIVFLSVGAVKLHRLQKEAAMGKGQYNSVDAGTTTADFGTYQ